MTTPRDKAKEALIQRIVDAYDANWSTMYERPGYMGSKGWARTEKCHAHLDNATRALERGRLEQVEVHLDKALRMIRSGRMVI